MPRQPKGQHRNSRSHRLFWECLEDRCLLTGLGGLLTQVLPPVNIAPPSPAPVVVATSTGALAATGPAPGAPVVGLLSPTGVGGLLNTGLPQANPTSSGPPANTLLGGGLSVGNALTGVLGPVEQPVTSTLVAIAPVPSGGNSSSGSGDLLGGGPLLGLSLSAGLGLGDGGGTGVHLGAQVDLLGAPLLGVSAGASLGQTTTGPGLALNVGADLGGSQPVSLGVTTDPAPDPSGGSGSGGGLTLGVVGLGIEVNLGGTGPVTPRPGVAGDNTVVPAPSAGAGDGSPLDGNPGGGTNSLPSVAVPPVVVEPPAVSVPTGAGDGMGNSERGGSDPGHQSTGGAGQVPPLAEVPAVATAVSGGQPEAVQAVPQPAVALAAVPHSGEFFLSAGAADASRDLPYEPATAGAGERPAANQLGEDLGLDALFADSSLWGAGNSDLLADDVVAELAALTASAGRADRTAATPAALLPGEALDVPASREAGLLAACVPYDVQSLDLAFRRLMDQLQSLGWDCSTLLARLPGGPWVLMFAAMAVTCEACRRRLAKAGQRLAPAGGAGGTLTWFPRLSTHEPGDDG
jgi:hypothetical protein